MYGIYLGPKYACLICALGDLIGALLFPFGAYFPGFTISAALMGLVYGLILYKKPGKEQSDLKFIIELIISSIIVLFGIKIFMESEFLNIMYGKAYWVVVSSRLVTQLIMLPIQVITIYFLEKSLRPFAKKYLYKEERITIDEYLSTFDKFTKDPNLDAMKYLMEKFRTSRKESKIYTYSRNKWKRKHCRNAS